MSKSTILKIFISILAIIIAVILLVYVSNKINISSNNTNEIQKVQQECEHDWIVTSEYDFIFNSYKTISKCSKCGKK